MNKYLVKIAKLKDTGKIVAKARSFIHGGSDQLEAMRNTREIAHKSLKAVSDPKTKAYLKDAYRAIHKDHLGTGGAMQGLEAFAGS